MKGFIDALARVAQTAGHLFYLPAVLYAGSAVFGEPSAALKTMIH